MIRLVYNALRHWLRLLADQGITDSPLFRRAVAVQPGGAAAGRRGRGEAAGRPGGGRGGEARRPGRLPRPHRLRRHSLRSGFLTTGGCDGIPLDLLMQLSGHKSHRIAARYVQAGAVHQNPAVDLL